MTKLLTRLFYPFLFCSAFLLNSAKADESGAPVDTLKFKNSPKQSPPLAATKKKDIKEGPVAGFLPVPAVFFTPETGFGGGLGVLYSYQKDESVRPTTFLPVAIFTEKKQTIIKLFVDSYLSGGEYYVESELGYTNYPDRFYGLGAETKNEDREDFTERYASGSMNAHMRISKNLYLGPSMLVENASVLKKDPNGLLASARIYGSQGGQTRALGLRLLYDSRDNLFTPKSGRRMSAQWLSSEPNIASDHRYQQLKLRMRHYQPIAKNDVIALELKTTLGEGDIPFRKMSTLGGQYLLRGYFWGRFRDKNLWASQISYRKYWGPLGAVVFAGAGSVSARVSGLNKSRVISSYGFGVRYVLVAKTGAGFRLDYALGRDEKAVYFGVSEAF